MPAASSYPQKVLHKLGLVRDIDLALHLPLRYEDETRLGHLREARDGEVLQFEATVTSCQVSARPRRQLLVTVDDGTDTCVLRFFTFYPAQQKALTPAARVRLRGEIKGGLMGWTMMHPSVKPAGGALAQTLTPVYPTAAGLPQAYLRKAVLGGLARAALQETLPATLLEPGSWLLQWPLRSALELLHQPAPELSPESLLDRSHPAWQRLKAEELLAQQLSQLRAKRERATLVAPRLQSPASPCGVSQRLLQALPFALTQAQRRVCTEITHDLTLAQPMHRLLQGDVGSGKTVVAALAAVHCIEAGWQCALMAPTEILAQQHFTKLVQWLEPLGIRSAWLTGGQKARERRHMLTSIASGEANLVIGTHAVIQDKVKFAQLGLAIIDEQHRFGVAQRLALRSKMNADAAPADALAPPASKPAAPNEPHLLMMTATPIPRTLAMSYYADLDVSTLDELPPGRTPVITKLVQDGRRDQVIARIQDQLRQGRQVYWVCPLIEESETLDLANARQTYDELSSTLNLHGQGVRVGLLHSRMPSAEKQAVMALFQQGQMQVLVSTTVIEVGVDVPNASLMVIEHAERFGLSQLHQLRGRVGRGAAASACVLLYSSSQGQRLSEAARERLKAMVHSADGFEIARRDLEIRGPGEFLGARQSGTPMLRFADLSTDLRLLEWAKDLAPRMLQQYPEQTQLHIDRWLGGQSDYMKA